MLKHITLFLLTLALSLTTVFAVAHKAAKSSKPMINLYEAPSSTKVIATVPFFTRMVPIIKKGHWAKVGLRSDGRVGWINLDNYKKQREALLRPNIQTVYVSTTEDDKGKPTVNIIAYHNGKKLSAKQAKAYYEKMLKQQHRELHAQRKYWRHFNRMMRFQQHEMDDMMRNDTFFGDDQPIILMPGPVMLPASNNVSRGKVVKAAKASH